MPRAHSGVIRIEAARDPRARHDTRESAFRRERAIKEWRRAWKLRLIEADNPTWRDLFAELSW